MTIYKAVLFGLLFLFSSTLWASEDERKGLELSLGIEMEKTIGIYIHDGFETTKGNPIDYILPVSLSYEISPGIITTFGVELVH